MTGRQCAAARALLQWKRAVLFEESGVCLTSLGNFERGVAGLRRSNLAAVRSVLERAGVVFIHDKGVMLK